LPKSSGEGSGRGGWVAVGASVNWIGGPIISISDTKGAVSTGGGKNTTFKRNRSALRSYWSFKLF